MLTPRLRVSLFVVFTVFFACLAAHMLFGADYYRLKTVKRLDQDLYKTFDGLYIETQYCYHYSYGEDATLKWDGAYSMDNKIIWFDDSICGVKKIWKK